MRPENLERLEDLAGLDHQILEDPEGLASLEDRGQMNQHLAGLAVLENQMSLGHPVSPEALEDLDRVRAVGAVVAVTGVLNV